MSRFTLSVPALEKGALVDNGLELLTEEQCLGLLGSEGIGRIGVSVAALPVILPVNYCVHDGAIFFRTAAGTKLHAASDRTIVAFEVDDVDPVEHSGWSVLVIGRAGPVSEAEVANGSGSLPVTAWAPGERDHLVKVTIEMISGRRIRHEAMADRALDGLGPGSGDGVSDMSH
ncbi:MAG: pyridoxamine 5'-phosphate oxidase family protein [Acidimicrobiales bacterium]